MRHKDWPEKLVAYLHHNLDTPFEWGTFDCCLFAADAVHAMTGIDFAAAFRGKYHTEKGAVRALIKYGNGDIKHTLNAIFGPLKPRLNAGRGDLVLVGTDTGDALGVVASGKIWVATLDGLATMPLSHAQGCWSVPCHQ